MFQEFDDTSKLHVDRDNEGIARNLFHVEEPYLSSARTAQQAAHEYLEKFRDVLGIKSGELRNLGLSPETKPIDTGIEYRFLEEKTQFDTTTVVYSQTYLGLPVWEAGLAVHTQQNPFRVMSAQCTRHADVDDAEKPSEKALNRIEKLDSKLLAKHMGLSEEHKDFNLKSMEIVKQRLIVGLTFVLDPDQKWPPREFDDDDKEDEHNDEDDDERENEEETHHEGREEHEHEESSEPSEKEPRRIRLEIDLD